MQIYFDQNIKTVEDINKLRKCGLAEYSTAALYLVYLAQKKFCKQWCQGRRSNAPLSMLAQNELYILEEYIDLGRFYNQSYPVPKSADDIVKNFRLKGMSNKAHLALDYWCVHPQTLVLLNHIPNVTEVLTLQAKGKRCVTMIAKQERISEEIFASKDAYQFLIHDLEHAACFINKTEWKEGQIGLYCFMLKSLANSDFENTFNDSLFKEKLDYALSDMNAHCIHLIKYIKGILIEHALRMFGQASHELMCADAARYLKMLIKGIGEITNSPVLILEGLLALNNPGEEKYFIPLEQFFNQYDRRFV